MKLIIAGGRDFNDEKLMIEEVNKIIKDIPDKELEIVSGMARGADRLGYKLAKANNIAVKEFPADWNQYEKAAGYIRNEQMAEYGDTLIAFWDGSSKGTEHMINIAKDNGLAVHVVQYEDKPF